MENYSILLNQIYLYLKQYPANKPNFSQIAKKVGLSRQTVAKEYAKIEEKDWDRFDIKNFYEDVDNKYKRALKIIGDLDNKYYNLRELSEMLGVSVETLSDSYNSIKDKEEENASAVYGCFYKDKLIYVGSTENYKRRVQQHLANIKNINNTSLELYKYLKDKDIEDIKFRPFITGISTIEYKKLEKNLIRFLKPECNVEFL